MNKLYIFFLKGKDKGIRRNIYVYRFGNVGNVGLINILPREPMLFIRIFFSNIQIMYDFCFRSFTSSYIEVCSNVSPYSAIAIFMVYSNN
jgi:hypothetical protein